MTQVQPAPIQQQQPAPDNNINISHFLGHSIEYLIESVSFCLTPLFALASLISSIVSPIIGAWMDTANHAVVQRRHNSGRRRFTDMDSPMRVPTAPQYFRVQKEAALGIPTHVSPLSDDEHPRSTFPTTPTRRRPQHPPVYPSPGSEKKAYSSPTIFALAQRSPLPQHHLIADAAKIVMWRKPETQ